MLPMIFFRATILFRAYPGTTKIQKVPEVIVKICVNLRSAIVAFFTVFMSLMGSFFNVAFAQTAAAPANIDKLKQMKVSGTDLNIPPVPQSGKNADAIRANLKRVNLPPGFKIELYAIVPDARHMAVAPSTNMLFVGTRKTTVWAVTDRDSDGTADEVKAFAPSLAMQASWIG